MTCNLTYHHSSGGRSLHKLTEILSVYSYAYLLGIDCRIKRHRSWGGRDQRIIPYERFLDLTDGDLDPDLPTLEIDRYTKRDVDNWWGLSYEKFTTVKKEIAEFAAHHDNNINVVFRHLSTVQPHQVYNWYNSGLIDSDIYTEKLIPKLRSVFDCEEYPLSERLEQIAIHIRRGDMYWQLVRAGKAPSNTEYVDIIKMLTDKYDLPVVIYTEAAKSEDLDELASDTVKICRGTRNDTKRDFYNMARSRVLVPACESHYSGWAALLNTDAVGLLCKCLLLKNLQFETLPPNMFQIPQ